MSHEWKAVGFAAAFGFGLCMTLMAMTGKIPPSAFPWYLDLFACACLAGIAWSHMGGGK